MITTLPASDSLAALEAGPQTASVFSRLEAKRDELLQSLARLRSDGLEIAQTAEAMESAVNLQDRERRAADIRRADATLLAVNCAIARCRLGCGGQCTECDAQISEKRLAAVPEAATCRDCQEAMEARA